jgi:histone H3/H4
VHSARPPRPPAPGSTEAPGAAAPGSTNEPSSRGLLRKSAVRRFLKKEFDFPLQIREAFFAAAEARFSEDLRRSVARARELKRNTLMGPDA